MNTPIHRDSRGTQIEVGRRVAYNRSGDVIEGEVVYVGSTIKVDPAHGYRRNPSGRPSTVKHGRSILVLS